MRQRLVIGFLPLLDCAPLVAAAAKGFAAEEGLELELVRESSWATIRDRIIVGKFDAAHMLGPMPIASTLGIGHLQVPMIAPMALGLGGNGITVSASLWSAMQRHGAALGADPTAQGAALKGALRERAAAGEPPLTIAMVYPFSAHNYELRYWLAACGVDPDEDVRLVVIPPPLMVDALRLSQIDGFCAGEPWNSLAVAGAAGRIVTATSAIWRLSPEKVLGMRADWASRHASASAALVRAVHRACAWCDDARSHPELAALLAQPQHLGQTAQIIERGLSGRLQLAPDSAAFETPEFLVFSRHWANFPWQSHALWFYTQMVRWQQLAASPAALAAARDTYRPDLYRAALLPLGLDVPLADFKVETASRGDDGRVATGFFDGRTFDPRAADAYIETLRHP